MTIRSTSILAVVVLALAGVAHAQGPVGYTRLASTTSLTYTDMAVVSGQVNNYVVTATNGAGESAPSNAVTATTPSVASTVCGAGNQHCNILTWVLPPTDATHGPASSYTIYKQLVNPPNPPNTLAVGSN